MKVHDIMTQPPQTCHASTRLATASRRMKDSATGMLVVLDGRGRVTGVVTDRDIALALSGPNQDVAHLCVDSAMSRHAHTCRETTICTRSWPEWPGQEFGGCRSSAATAT